MTTQQILQGVHDWTKEKIREVVDGENVPALAESLAPWADQKAIATPDTYTDAVRTTGGDIPIETSAGSKIESIKPVAGSKWTAKMLFNGSYNMLNAAKWGAANSQPYVGGVGNDFVYFLVPELTLGTFGTADENNGLLFTDSEGENVQPTSVYFKPLGATVPQSLTDGTSVSPTSVSYDGKTYKDYATSGAGWLIVPKTVYDNDVCAHIAWEDWYDKYVSLDEPTTNPEAVVGTLILEGLLALAHSDKYLRGVNNEVCDNVVFGDTSATITHMVDEISVVAASWTNASTGESDSHGNALYRHSATVSGIKQGGAACVEGENGGIPLTVNGTTVSYVDTNATAPASVVFYEVASTSTTKAYTDSVFNGSNINTETGVLPINDCSIEAQVAIDGKADITVKYAKNIVDQVAINATVDVPQIKEQVEEHEERITNLEDTAVRTGSYDASVAVGLADNFKGDTIVDAEFYKRKTGGTQSVGSGIAAIKEMRGKSIVWNQLVKDSFDSSTRNGITISADTINHCFIFSGTGTSSYTYNDYVLPLFIVGHKYYYKHDVIDNPNNITTIRWGLLNQMYCQSTDAHFKIIAVADSIGNAIGIDGGAAGVDVTGIKVRFTLFDLTLMFGAGNEPATVEEFEKMFPLDYYDYNAGEVIPFAGQNLITTGFNQWDEQWGNYYWDEGDGGTRKTSSASFGCANKIPVLPSTEYYFQRPASKNFYILFYDATENLISYVTKTQPGTFTTPEGCRYITFYSVSSYGTTYNNDICINISNPDRNGTYEPYEKHTLPLDPSQWRDKQGNLVFPYGGMHGVGTVYDYAKVDADGYIRKVVRCFEKVDLGSRTWGIRQVSGTQFFAATFPDANSTTTNNAICSKYILDHRQPNMMKDKSFNIQYWTSNQAINILDSSYNNAATFKTAMNGVMLYYELVTPVEIELATPVYAKYLVDKDGTEKITPANGTTPYTTMANLSILYAMDARGEIKNLPKNYLSKESAENMLNAMISAGVIASYTMTWDSTNSRYVFVIQKNSEQSDTNN